MNQGNIQKDMQEFRDLDPFIDMPQTIIYDQSNPFFVPDTGSKLLYVKTKLLANDYKYVYVLCLQDNLALNTNIINRIKLFHAADSDIPELTSQKSMITMLRGPFELACQTNIREGLVEISNSVLEHFNHQSYELCANELVYLMLETREHNVKSWLDIYNTKTSLDKFIEQKIFTSYYNLADNKIEQNLIDLINSVDDFSYWTNYAVCNLNNNKKFSERRFNLIATKKWGLPDDIEKNLQKMIIEFVSNRSTLKSDSTYPHQLTNSNLSKAKGSKGAFKIAASKIRSKSTYGRFGSKVAGISVKKAIVAPSNTDNTAPTTNVTSATTGPTVCAPVSDTQSFYEIVNQDNLVIKKESIEELIIGHSLSEKEKYYLVCNLLVSKNYCHYVLNNTNVLTHIKPMLKKYMPVFRYLIGFAWIALYKEETIRKTKAKQSDRFVFSLGTASELPVFPFASEAPYTNPYYCCTIADSLTAIGKNISGVKQSHEWQNGIVDLDEFRRRMNIFISGSNKNVLDGVNWSNMVVTGGIMAATIPKTMPLMSLFKKSSTIDLTDSELNSFFNEYYATSDIDIACNFANILDFIDHVKHIRSIICKNLALKESEVRIAPLKSLAIFINEKILKEKCENGSIPFKYDYIVANKTKRSVKFYFYEMYLERKKISNETNRAVLGDRVNDDEYFEVIDYCEFDKVTLVINNYLFDTEYNNTPNIEPGVDMVYYVNENDTISAVKRRDSENSDCSANSANSANSDHLTNNPINLGDSVCLDESSCDDDNGSDNDDNDVSIKSRSVKNNIFIKFSETLKYKITSSHLGHCFEVFKIADTEFFASVSKFHLPCVRSYYNGTDCFMLPSAITAYHTLTNIDFKYFVGACDPISIIDKYRRRGYGTLLNKAEIEQYLSYVSTVDKCKKAYNITGAGDINSIVGSRSVSDNIFKPRKYLPEDYALCKKSKTEYSNLPIKYTQTTGDIVKIYQSKYPSYASGLITMRVVNANGAVDPLKKWVIDASYDIMQTL